MASLFIASVPASALDTGVDPIRAADNAVWLTVGGSYLDYKETDLSGGTADTEKGWTPAASLGVSFLSGDKSNYVDNLYLALESIWSFGYTRYTGTLLTTGAPYQGTTEENIWATNVRLGKGFAINNKFMTIPFAELGFRYWNRDLGAYVEDYHNFEALGGLLVQYSPASQLVLSLSGAGGTTFAPAMTATNPTTHFDLGSMPVWKATGKVGYAVTDRFEVLARVDYVQFKLGESQLVFNANDGKNFYEPNSQTKQVTTQIGLAYHY
jgi:hypothetical protein